MEILQKHAKLLLSLLGSAIFALIVAIVLAAISVSGVTSMTAASVFLWIALSIFGATILATGILSCPSLSGGKSALLAISLLLIFCVGWIGRKSLAEWLDHKKAAQNSQPQPVLSLPNNPNESKPSVPIATVHPKPAPAPAPAQTNFQAGSGSVLTNNQSGGTNIGTYINQADATRHLSAMEALNLSISANEICPSLPKFGVTASGANAEAQRYAAEIVSVLNAHGCNATFSLPIPSLEATVVGIHIGVTDIHAISPSALALQKLINPSGLSATINPKGKDFYAGDDFVLAIGAKD